MWDILPFKTAYVPFGSLFKLKQNPTSYYDRFSPSPNENEHLLNSVLKATRLNATIEEEDTQGHCLWVNNTNVCTGIMKMIMDGHVDVSLLVSSLGSYQSGTLFPQLKFGLFERDTRSVFMSTSQEQARNASVNPFNITDSIPWSIILVDILALLTLMLWLPL